MTSTASEVTQVQSLAAIRNFIRVAVSCVTYLRGLCSDDSYQPRQFLGLQLKQLVRSSPEADSISQWMEDGVFDALNKGYLKEIALCIYTPDCGELLESYCFGISYSADGQRASMTFTNNTQQKENEARNTTAVSRAKRKRRTRQEVQQALIDIITKLMEIVEGLPPLLCERVLTMRLTYHEDVTPPSYEPPCFAPASAHLVQLHRQEQQYSTDIAMLETGHHVMSVAIRHRFLAQLRSQFMSDAKHATATETLCSNAGTTEEERDDGAAHSFVNSRASQRRGLGELAQQKEGTLRADDVAFCVFAAFVLTKSSLAGRGRVSAGEIDDYLRTSCPFDLTSSVVSQMMRRLGAEGLVVPDTPHGEWTVQAPTSALVTFLLQQSQVLPLLCQNIRRDLERINKASAQARVSIVGGGARKRPRPHSLVLGGL